jgi:hypothetical protein
MLNHLMRPAALCAMACLFRSLALEWRETVKKQAGRKEGESGFKREGGRSEHY